MSDPTPQQVALAVENACSKAAAQYFAACQQLLWAAAVMLSRKTPELAAAVKSRFKDGATVTIDTGFSDLGVRYVTMFCTDEAGKPLEILRIGKQPTSTN